jgi:demethylspheroidene O-methyltransferase
VGGARAWRDWWPRIRDRLLTSRRFRDWAAASILTRPIARRRAREVFDLCAGFVYSQVLFACVQLRLFDLVRTGPLPCAMLESKLALPRDALARLLAAAVALELLERRGPELIGLGVRGAALIDNPGVVAMIEHHAMLYADLRDPVALLRGRREGLELERYWVYARGAALREVAPERVRDYTALMAASQQLIAGEVLDAYPLSRHRCLLDVGGGAGAFLIAAAARAPHLELMLFDLPAVADLARLAFERAGIASRARAIGGDFHGDALPTGADLVCFVRVLHDHDDDRVLALLRAARAALPPGGQLLIAEPLAGTPGAETVGDAYFNFYLLAMGSGRARTVSEFTALLGTAGFRAPRLLPTRMPLQTSVLLASPAGEC